MLVTGGAGFIGSNLVKYVNRRRPKWSVSVIDDLSSGFKSNLNGADCELFEASVLDSDALENAMRPVDYVVHLAALGSVQRSIDNPVATHEANVTGTLRVLEASRKFRSKYVVVASSSSVYGSNPNLPRNELDWTRPLSPYAVSKLATESYAIAFAESYGLTTLAFRFFNVYGPGQRGNHPYAAVIPKFISSCLRSEPLQIHGHGKQSRDFTYVDSVCQALLRACESTITHPHALNLAFGTSTSVNQIAIVLEEVLGRPIPRVFHPKRVGDVAESQADPSEFLRLFPEVEAYDLKEGIQKTVGWFFQK